MRLARSCVGALLCLAPLAAHAAGDAAEPKGATGAEWDHRHMLSGRSLPEPWRPIERSVSGASRYGQIDTGAAQPVRAAVPETIDATQRDWSRGPSPSSDGLQLGKSEGISSGKMSFKRRRSRSVAGSSLRSSAGSGRGDRRSRRGR